MTVQEITSLMPAFEVSPQVHRRQTATRVEIADVWGIAPDDRLLDIGCGQGDTTAVSAALGASVLAVDPADPSYGAP